MAIPVGIFSRESTPTEETRSKEGTHWSSFLTDRNRIQVLRLYGAIQDEDDASMFPETDTAAWVKRKLRKAVDDDKIKGILIRINSPGGTVGMSQEVYEAVRAVRAKGTPVVVSMGDVTASGGYYIAAAADRIFANPGTLTGSIGVIMHLMNWQETEKKIGIYPQVIKSGQFKDIGSPDRPMTAPEKELLQTIIMDSYDQFVTAVATGRKMDKDAVKKLADGRIYSGRQAQQAKLVDDLGGYDEALAWLQKTCKKKYKLTDDMPVDDGSGSLNIFASLLGGSRSQTSLAKEGSTMLKSLLPTSMDPKFNKVPLWIMQ